MKTFQSHFKIQSLSKEAKNKYVIIPLFLYSKFFSKVQASTQYKEREI